MRPRTLPKFKSSTDGSEDRQRLLALINGMSDSVLALDQSGKILLTNGAALNLLDRNNLTGLDFTQALKLYDKSGHPVDLRPLLQKSAQAFTTRELKLRYQDGSFINLYLNLAPVHLGFGKGDDGGYVLLIRDITREKSLEEERDEFISVASHELRTPVAVAEGNISNALLLADKGQISTTVVQSLKSAYEQILFLSNLINDLSMLSRADRGNLAYSSEDFDVSPLLEELALSYQEQAAKKGLALKHDTPAGPIVVRTSRLYLKEIIQNFITNSLKYTEKGEITIKASKLPNAIRVEVTDSGIGISQSEQSKLFSKFFRSDDWRVKKLSGTGLGLYVSAKLADLLGGRIEAQSELNKGSSFSIIVPSQAAS